MQSQPKPVASPAFSQHLSSAQILSAMPLTDCHGSLTIFKGFTSTKPDRELVEVSWDDAAQFMCPSVPAQLADKKDGLFFVPCLLKEAPLVGNTLAAAVKNGQPQISKMRSKQHVTKASFLVIDIDGLTEEEFDGGLAKMKADGLTFVAFTTHSHGREDKPGIRARIVIALDRPINTDEYAAAWHGVDKHYWNGQVGKADSSGANLYQQQGTWCCDPSRVKQAKAWRNTGGVASADALIAIGKRLSAANLRAPKPQNRAVVPANGVEGDYPPADANKVADACRQIGTFRDTKGAGQSEPCWRDCIGVVGHCVNGTELCQEWSSGHSGYDERETADKLDYRMKTPPTTCAQFQKTNPAGCSGCTQQRNSPITLGWESREDFEVVPFEVVDATPKPPAPKVPASKMPAALSKVKPLVTAVVTAVTPASTLASAPTNVTGGSSLPFPNIAPHAEPVDIALLLNEISDTIRIYIILDKEQADAAALWIAHTYLLRCFDTSPIAIVNAPEKACAKTLFQYVVSLMVLRPLMAANASLSALFRSIEMWEPTVIIDEADTFLRDNIELQGMINAGYKRGGFVLRTEGSCGDFEPKMFAVYSAKSIAGIALEKHLPDSTMSRGIIFNLRRKLPHEKVSRLRDAPPGLFSLISSKLLRFAADYAEQLRLARPVLPDELSDRAQDNWEPLLAIAGCAGDEWVARATSAALILSSSSEESVSPGNELLADIQDVFANKKVEKISSADLIEALCGIADGAWSTYSHGKQLTPRQLSKLLGTYKISPKTVRMKFGDTPKGYDLGQFRDVFARYLAPSELPQQRNVSPEAMPFMAPGVALDPHTPTVSAATPPLDVSATQKTLLPVPCGGVADVAANTEGAADMPQEDAF